MGVLAIILPDDGALRAYFWVEEFGLMELGLCFLRLGRFYCCVNIFLLGCVHLFGGGGGTALYEM